MGKNWAIAIGINQYYNLQHLNCAQRDTELVRDFFLKEAGFEEVFYFSDESPAINKFAGQPIMAIPTQPTYANLRRFLRKQFEEPLMEPGDNFWFFFSGHGLRYADRDYLMPCDADPGDVEHTGIPINYVTERLRRCGADNVVLIVDACRDQGQKDGRGIGEEKHQGVITIFSCSPNEKSYEIEDENLRQASFTYALLEGLRLQGEANCATVERLYQHLYHRVPEINQRYGKPRQTPYLKAEPPYKMHFILLNKLATIKDAEPLKFQAATVENEGDLELAEQLWIRVLGVSSFDRDALRAIKRITLKQSGQHTNSKYPIVTTTSGLKSSVSELSKPQPEQPPHLEGNFSLRKSDIVSSNPSAIPVIASRKLRGVRASATQVEVVRNALMLKGWSQKALAQNCSLTQSTISRFLKQELIDCKTFEIICKALDLPPEAILLELTHGMRKSCIYNLAARTSISNNKQTKSSKNFPSPANIHTFEFEVISVNLKGQEIERRHQIAEYRIEKLGDIVLEIVLIPGGTFLMGSPESESGGMNNEKPQHSVTIQPFLIGKYPITQAQWKAVAAFDKVNRDIELEPSHFKGADRPVEQVSWYDAVEFCDRLSRKTGREYRLPTEAEWEYACRAGTTTPFHFGETITPDVANYDCNYSYKSGSKAKGSYRKQTSPVKTFAFANAFGLFDMHGNVWEWCLDYWYESYHEAPTKGSAWLTDSNSNSRVLRGGSWLNDPRDCRSAHREYGDSDTRFNRFGFRIVCPIV